MENLSCWKEQFCWQDHIFKLMKSDSYSRYLRSDQYKEFLSGTRKKVRLLSGIHGEWAIFKHWPPPLPPPATIYLASPGHCLPPFSGCFLLLLLIFGWIWLKTVVHFLNLRLYGLVMHSQSLFQLPANLSFFFFLIPPPRFSKQRFFLEKLTKWGYTTPPTPRLPWLWLSSLSSSYLAPHPFCSSFLCVPFVKSWSV